MSLTSQDHLARLTGDACEDTDIFRDLSPADRQRVERQIGGVHYSAGYTFFQPDEEGDRIFFLRQGRVRLYKLSPEGRALTLYLLEPGGVFGELALSDAGRHDSFAEAMTDCTVGSLRRDECRALLETYPVVALRFAEVISQRLRALERKLADLTFRSVPQRLATLLLSLADCHPLEHPNAAPVVIRYTHQQLAEMIGSYRETVTKAIGEFREAGLIRIEDDAIHLIDVPRLQQLAER